MGNLRWRRLPSGAFVAAGVPHVIAVRKATRLLDKAAQIFTSHFYSSLAVGDTVRAAFEIATQTVLTAPPDAAGVAGAAGTAVAPEARKFLLLPEDDLTLAVVLKGPLIGFDDDDLFDLAYDRGAMR